MRLAHQGTVRVSRRSSWGSLTSRVSAAIWVAFACVGCSGGGIENPEYNPYYGGRHLLEWEIILHDACMPDDGIYEPELTAFDLYDVFEGSGEEGARVLLDLTESRWPLVRQLAVAILPVTGSFHLAVKRLEWLAERDIDKHVRSYAAMVLKEQTADGARESH